MPGLARRQGDKLPMVRNDNTDIKSPEIIPIISGSGKHRGIDHPIDGSDVLPFIFP